ncbi:hypothetical protein [Saccharicrinis sp. 156]|uniref:hypothetical protein n=1 Tax=Saccharicrinis sp. 156 TaxID=3417574 RepID=UPI003D3559BF
MNTQSRNTIWLVLWAVSFLCAEHTVTAQGKFKDKADLQFLTGLNRGFGLGTNIIFEDLSTEFPFDIRIGLGYTWLNPGNSSKARRVFINDATNGTPEKKGRNIDLRLDLLKGMTLLGNSNSYWFVGPRYSFFNGNFKYVGGNEDFDITTKQFGIGGGLESRYAISDNLKLIATAGLDYYLAAKMQGHDTAYYRDNDNVNARNKQGSDTKYKYKDADNAVDQPKFMPRLMVGIQWDF